MKIKCLCGIEAEYEIENDVVFCNECGTLLLNDLSDDTECKIYRLNQIKKQISELDLERKKLELDIRIGLEGAPVGVGKMYQVKYSSYVTKRFDNKKFKEEHEELYNKYTYDSPGDRITIKEV